MNKREIAILVISVVIGNLIGLLIKMVVGGLG